MPLLRVRDRLLSRQLAGFPLRASIAAKTPA